MAQTSPIGSSEMTDEFAPGDRVQIQDRDRDSVYYPDATVVRAGEIHFDESTEHGYLVRYDNGSEVWVHPYDVLAPMTDRTRAMLLAKRIRPAPCCSPSGSAPRSTGVTWTPPRRWTR
jgi:hypothetical protein